MTQSLSPVWDGYLADPFVLNHNGVFYAYGTGHGPEPDGRQFPILRSEDLKHWTYVAGALPPLQPDGSKQFTAYWAPEVAAHAGRFYLFYSAATEHRDETHRLRVAIADSPEGPFLDAGQINLPAPFNDVFCIDAHPFRDPASGKWFLFFATDFFDNRVGTGTAVVPLADDLRRATGPASPVLRATSDWHIYERNRTLYGKVWDAWHTVEGPFVLYHGGKYWCLYSGGNWQTNDYGVGFGVASHPAGPYTDEWNLEGPVVLRNIPNQLIGPGHCSAVIGPDGTDHLVYHAWNSERSKRQMHISKLLWTAHGPRSDAMATT